MQVARLIETEHWKLKCLRCRDPALSAGWPADTFQIVADTLRYYLADKNLSALSLANSLSFNLSLKAFASQKDQDQ